MTAYMIYTITWLVINAILWAIAIWKGEINWFLPLIIFTLISAPDNDWPKF